MKRFLALLLAVAALVAVAAFEVPAPAASVNGAGISRQSLDADLSAIAASTGYQCYLTAGLELDGQSATGLFPVTGAGSTSAGSTAASSTPAADYNTTFVRYWLTQMMSDVLVAQAVAARHLRVTPSDLALGRLSLLAQMTGVLSEFQNASGSSCGSSGSALFGALPASFRQEQVLAQSNRDVLLAHEAGYGLGTASLQRFFAAHRAEFDTECISYVGFTSQAAATAARTSIEGGTPIAQTGTLTRIGCGIQHSITSLPSSVTSLAVGKVSQPVSGGTGEYALLVVTSRKPTGFLAARTAVEQALLAAGTTRTNAILASANRRASVAADPRYGQVHIGTVALQPPASPPARFVLDPSAALPSALQPAKPASKSGSSPKGSGS